MPKFIAEWRHRMQRQRHVPTRRREHYLCRRIEALLEKRFPGTFSIG